MHQSSINELLHAVAKDYTNLWDFKLRGKTIEIITPHSTMSDKFVSVFVMEQGTDFVVTDGGYLFKSEYIEDEIKESACYKQAITYFEDHYKVRRVTDKLGTIICYKKTNQYALLSSVVHDMASFITAAVNAQQIASDTDTEVITRRKFTRQANDYLREAFTGRDIDFSSAIAPNITARFSAIIRDRSRINLVNYITGSDATYFANSIGRANINFEMLSGASVDDLVVNKISLLDDTSKGFDAQLFAGHLRVLRKVSPVVRWSSKEQLANLINSNSN
jgi:hypothetical protein